MVFKTITNNIRLGLMALIILVNLVIFFIFPKIISNEVFMNLLSSFISLLNNDINIHGNEMEFSNNKVIIMANHYHGITDCSLIYKMYYKHNKNNLYTVVKSNIVGDKTDGSYLLNMLTFAKDYIIKSLKFIPYIRGDREDGSNVKNIITEYLNNDSNVLIFPEGTTTRSGVPINFKTGIFRLAVEKQFSILPITIIYDKDIGKKDDNTIDNTNIFDNTANIYIHDMIDSNTSDFYKTNDFMGLKNKTYDVICSPFKVKENKEEKGEEENNLLNDTSK